MSTASQLESHAHFLRVGDEGRGLGEVSAADGYRSDIEPWLSAVLQSEHLSLLLGSGFTLGVATAAGIEAASMNGALIGGELADEVNNAAARYGAACGRSEPNIEDQIHAMLTLIEGLTILGDSRSSGLSTILDETLTQLLRAIARTERLLLDVANANNEEGALLRDRLMSFLLTFASRAVSRDRLQVFTTNYDRVFEWGCDLTGLRPLDRFVGALEPVFRASRLDVDLHYSPPGIRGEPRYLEGVIRLSKLHGSLDWRWSAGVVQRIAMPFGVADKEILVPEKPQEAMLIYPNPAKDVETSSYPYSELFRDLAAAVCRPNSALVTYGYGFGDDHINRAIEDMLSIPSTHLVVISYDWAGGRLAKWLERVGHESQISLMIGNHFADFAMLNAHYLPKPAIDTLTARRAELLRRREVTRPVEQSASASVSGESS